MRQATAREREELTQIVREARSEFPTVVAERILLAGYRRPDVEVVDVVEADGAA
jgi:hypothetical protein